MCFTWKTSLIWLFSLNPNPFLPFRPRRHHARQPPGKPCYGNGFSMVLRAAGCASGWKSINFMKFHGISCFHVKFVILVFLQKKRKFSFLAISSLSASPAQKPYKRNAFSCVSGVHWRPFSGKHEKVQKNMKPAVIS